MPSHSFSASSYRYGFNGQEKDDEVAGAGNINTAMYWEYDNRLGRRWNIDPEPYPFMSDYSCFANNPILLPDPLGNRVKYGSDGSTKAEKRRIKDQIREERKNNSGFDAEFRAHKKDKDITYQYEDKRSFINKDGENIAVTGATIHDRVMDDPHSVNDKTRIVAWNITHIKLPKSIEFVNSESYMQTTEQTQASQNAMEMNIDRTYSHRLKDDPIKSQIALWLSVNKNSSITIIINEDSTFGYGGATSQNELKTPSQIRKSRENEIKAAFKSLPYINYRTQIHIEKGNSSYDKTSVQQRTR
jgi:hypothetical protein